MIRPVDGELRGLDGLVAVFWSRVMSDLRRGHDVTRAWLASPDYT